MCTGTSRRGTAATAPAARRLLRRRPSPCFVSRQPAALVRRPGGRDTLQDKFEGFAAADDDQRQIAIVSDET